jgi:DNA-binding MarR family transcriptional regulator
MHLAASLSAFNASPGTGIVDATLPQLGRDLQMPLAVVPLCVAAWPRRNHPRAMMIDPDVLFTGLCRAGLDLNTRQIGILLACTAKKPKAPESREQCAIAAHLGLRKASASRNTDRLVELEFVERVLVEEDNRRRIVLPTAAGVEVAAQIRDGMREAAVRSADMAAA